MRIVIADDHPVVAQGIARYCEDEGIEVLATVGSVGELLEVLDREEPEVISLDVQIPGMKGPSTVAEIAARNKPILLFTFQKPSSVVASLVRAGARGYLLKSSSMDRYLEALGCLAEGGSYLPEELRARIEEPPARPPHELLTPREHEVFLLLARGETPKAAAWELGISTSTLYTHLNRIREKLDLESQADLLRLAAEWDLEAGSDEH